MADNLRRFYTVDDLLAPRDPLASYMEPRFIIKSGKTLIGGEAKIGKSWVSMEAARCIATGTRFGYGNTLWSEAPARVLLCDKELGFQSLGERLGRFLKDPDQMELARKNIFAVSGHPDFYYDAPHCRRAIMEQLDEIQPSVMIIDPVSKFMHGSDQDNDDVRRFLEFMDILIERYKSSTQLSIVMSHHFRKPQTDFRGNKVDPSNAYNFRGGSKWYDDQDALMTIQRHDVNDYHWRLECEIQTRHGKSPDTMWLDVKPESEYPVLESAKPEVKSGFLRDKLLK